MMSVTPKAPSVNFPVLSNMKAFKSRALSKLMRLRMSNPFLADNEVETAVTSGAAKPSACGHVMTMTVTIRSSATSNVKPSSNHIDNVIKPEAIEMLNYHFSDLFDNLYVIDFVSWSYISIILTYI